MTSQSHLLFLWIIRKGSNPTLLDFLDLRVTQEISGLGHVTFGGATVANTKRHCFLYQCNLK